jgi:hypothetical protein
LTFEGATGARFKAIPRDVRALKEFEVPDGLWEGLGLPINLAFIVERSDSSGRVAMYPSPAGVTESTVNAGAWDQLMAENPALRHLASDVEALLVNRLESRREAFMSPIDRCYELAGLIRTHWRGFSGGQRVRDEIESFFAKLRSEARPVHLFLEESDA